jgi:hypothetical protein
MEPDVLMSGDRSGPQQESHILWQIRHGNIMFVACFITTQ